MTRDEHLEWAKKDALKYWERGDLLEAVTVMLCDLDKHEELRNHPGRNIGVMWMMAPAMHQNRDFVYRFIVGFR